MAYYNALSFASGYYTIWPNGVVELSKDIPEDIRKRFWEVWPEFRKKVIETQKKGIYRSDYPTLPMTDEDPNRHQYE